MAEAPDPRDMTESVDKAEQEAADNAEGIMKNLMFRRLTSRYEQKASEGDLNVPPMDRHILNAISPTRSSSSPGGESQNRINEELGQTLADVGDKIEAKYSASFREMVAMLNLTPSTAYDTFASVARKLFDQGINWGRIIALFYFGLEIASSVINRGVEGATHFIKQILRFITQFLVREKIAKWIADNGGWKALIDIRKNTENLWFVRICALVAIGGIVFAATKWNK